MAIDLTVRSGVTRSFPQPGDTDLFGEVTNWANDVTTAVNQSPTTSTIAPFDAIVGTAANVSAGVATHSDIASAIAAVSANDRIFILENTYEPSAQIDINKALTIIGQGEGAAIEGDNLVSGAVVKISASGVTFENCKIIQGSGTPDYALEIAASMERININLKADGTFATALYLNGSDIGAICGFIAYDTSSVFFGGEVQLGEQVKIQDQTTPAYNMVIQSDSDGTALTADRILTFDVNDGPRTIDLSENFTIGDGFDVTITAEDAAGAIVLDNSNFEVENTDGTQRLFKIVSAKAGDTTLTFQENFTIGDGFDVSITSEDTANSIVLDEQNFEVEGEGTAQQLLKLVNANNAAATLTLEGTSSVINQDVTSDASPTFVGPVVQKITRDSASIQIETTTSGDIDLASVDKTVRLNASDATNATSQEILFGDDTGGITGVRNNSSAVEFNTAGAGWVPMVGTTSTQTLTNKTYQIGEAVNLTSTSTELNQLDGVSVGGSSAGDILTTDATQTLTNKTLTTPGINGSNLNFGTASNTNRVLLPSDTTVNLDLLTDTAALVAYDTTLSQVVYNTGGGWSPLASTSVVAMRYTTNAGQLITKGATVDIIYEDIDYDTSSMYNATTGVATIPVGEGGKYFYHAALQYADAAWTAGNVANIGVEVNGTAEAQNVQEFSVTITESRRWTITAVFDLNAGDTLEITSFHGRTGGNVNLSTSTLNNYVEIFKIG